MQIRGHDVENVKNIKKICAKIFNHTDRMQKVQKNVLICKEFEIILARIQSNIYELRMKGGHFKL